MMSGDGHSGAFGVEGVKVALERLMVSSTKPDSLRVSVWHHHLQS